jgi:hypothetical protein
MGAQISHKFHVANPPDSPTQIPISPGLDVAAGDSMGIYLATRSAGVQV